MQVESSGSSSLSNTEMREDEDIKSTKTASTSACKINVDDILLLCDLFYLPFEHGNRGTKLLTEFNWLKAHANVLICTEARKDKKFKSTSNKPEVAEWLQRAEHFDLLCSSVQQLVKKVALCANKEICHDLFTYVWDLSVTLTLLNAFVKWLSLADFPSNIYSYTQGSYTWFSRGWKDAFMSGDQEPWVFRGGLIADLQRLMPVDAGNDLFLYKQPETALSEVTLMRPYALTDEMDVNELCTKVFLQRFSNTVALAKNFNELIGDSIVGPFITFNPNFCILAHQSNSNSLVGYVAAALDAKTYVRKVNLCWMPAMREKYPLSLLSNLPENLEAQLRNMLNDFQRSSEYECPVEVCNAFPAVLTLAMLNDALKMDEGLLKRLLTVALATLRANGCFGVHVRLQQDDTEQLQCYTKLGFSEAYRDGNEHCIYMGRRF